VKKYNNFRQKIKSKKRRNFMLTEANATRTDGLITVRLFGQTPTPYDEATIVDYYPGTITYFTDPNSAQVFINEGRKPGLEKMYCPPIMGNTWIFNHIIHDMYHKTVEIFLNGCLARKVRVVDLTEKNIINIIDL
jgi:hypothetical protein